MRAPPACSLILGLILAGCGQEAWHPTSPTSAGGTSSLEASQAAVAVPMGAQSKLGDLWPNEDGRSWSFAYHYQGGWLFQPPLYSTPEEVPPAPTPQEVLSALRTPLNLPNVDDGTYSLHFDGQTTTLSGATGQNLIESLETPQVSRSATLPSFRERLLARLAQVRPDLAARIGPLSAPLAASAPLPFLVHGGAWVKALQYIGTYGDLDRDLAWKFLDADTRQGATFHFQLLPAITTDVFLDAWVLPKRLRSSDARGRAVEVVYVINYGVTAATDQTGAITGYFRDIGYGSVTYAPGQGPVALIERPIASAEHPEQAIAEITLQTKPSLAVADR